MAGPDVRRLHHFVAALASQSAGESPTARLGEASRSLLHADGVALTIATSTETRALIWTTGSLAARLQDVQDISGQGPSLEALTAGAAVVARFDDHGDQQGDGRWSLLHEQGRDLGFAGTLVAAPLMSEAGAFGVLTAHRHGSPRLEDVEDATFLGHAVAAGLLPVLDAAEDASAFDPQWIDRSSIHQATGMVVAQVSVCPGDAVALLRGQAFTQATTLREISQQVIDRRIDFGDFTIRGD